MKLGWKELLRRPRPFVVLAAVLVLLSLLLLYPSAILDGVLTESTAALRNAPGDLLVYSRDANGVLIRSRIDPALRDQVDAVDGTARVASFDVAFFAGKVDDQTESQGFVLLASDQSHGGDTVPGAGEALADSSLRATADVAEGSVVLVGPFQVPLTVVGFTHGTNLGFAGGLVVDKATWLTVLGAAAGGSAAGGPPTSQALLVTVADGADGDEVAAAIDAATGGATRTMDRAGAVRAIPGVEQQESTFGYLRVVTLVVELVVVGLYVSFVTLERAPLYSVLKAVGTSSRQLFWGLVVQVTAISDLSVYGAVLVTWGLTRLPLELPTEMRLVRVVETIVALRTAALVGSVLSLRRVVRVDPADAIG